MKSFLAYLCQRRWCRLLMACVILFGIACLHPFFRQSIFGPKIEGIPWCVWEDRIRGYRVPERRSKFSELLERLGFVNRGDSLSLYEILYYRALGNSVEEISCTSAPVPVYLHLADDHDQNVRQYALWELTRHASTLGPEALPTLRRRLEDHDPICRAYAARCVRRAVQDPEILNAVLPLLHHKDYEVRSVAISTLCQMAPHVPETFEPLATLAEKDDFATQSVLLTMPHFGRRAVPILRKRLIAPRDPHNYLGDLGVALGAVRRLGKDAAELTPDLLALQDHPNPTVRELAAEALASVEPFPRKR